MTLECAIGAFVVFCVKAYAVFWIAAVVIAGGALLATKVWRFATDNARMRGER